RPGTAPCPLSLHDALPISARAETGRSRSMDLAGLSARKPRKVAWRTWPEAVHSANDTSAISSGLTQCAPRAALAPAASALLSVRSEEHTSELQSRENLVCR